MEVNSTTTIEVDLQAAEILGQAAQQAEANGETLGQYLSENLKVPDRTRFTPERQLAAWMAFVEGMSNWARDNLPPGYVADDSRESIYEDRL